MLFLINSNKSGRNSGSNRGSRRLWLVVLIAAVPAVFAAMSIGIAFGLSRGVSDISDVCNQSNIRTNSNATPVVYTSGPANTSSSQTGAQCDLIFNGFGSAWRYDGGKFPIGLRIDSQEKALQVFGKPGKDSAVFEGSSFGEGVVISATNQVGGPALYVNGAGTIQGHRSEQGPELNVTNAGSDSALFVSNQGPNPALKVGGGVSAVYSHTEASALAGTDDAQAFNANGTRGSAQYGWGVQGDSHYGVGVYAATYNNNMPALFATNGGDGAVGYTMKGGGPAFEFDGDGKIKGNVQVQGSMSVSNLAVNADSEPLQQGDLVVIVGSTVDGAGNPILQVKKSRNAADPQVIGVVDKPYSPPSAIPVPLNDPNQNKSIATGDQVLIATIGTYKVIKVDASNGSILPGNLLVSSGTNPGYAAKAKPIEINGQQLPPMGVFGKALTAFSGDKGTIAVLLTQH